MLILFRRCIYNTCDIENEKDTNGSECNECNSEI